MLRQKGRSLASLDTAHACLKMTTSLDTAHAYLKMATSLDTAHACLKMTTHILWRGSLEILNSGKILKLPPTCLNV